VDQISSFSGLKEYERGENICLQVMTVAAQAYFSRYVETLKRLQKVVNEIAVI
jgi:hypothetical protein